VVTADSSGGVGQWPTVSEFLSNFVINYQKYRLPSNYNKLYYLNLRLSESLEFRIYILLFSFSTIKDIRYRAV